MIQVPEGSLGTNGERCHTSHQHLCFMGVSEIVSEIEIVSESEIESVIFALNPGVMATLKTHR